MKDEQDNKQKTQADTDSPSAAEFILHPSSFILSVRLFAAMRDLAGSDTEVVELPDGASVGDLRRELGKQLPLARTLLARSAIAVNQNSVENEHVITATDECAVIPPVSGG